MSPQHSSSGGQWPPLRPSKRSKLRNGTFVIPTTGERSHRQFTLRHPPSIAGSHGGDDASDAASIYSRRGLARTFKRVSNIPLEALLAFFKFLGTPKGRGVLKCTLAYVLGSLMTFVPPFAELLGKPDGKHVTATITVYFHPSRTAGSMIQAILIAFTAVIYAALISVLSMATSVLFGSVLDAPTIAFSLILIVFVGGGFGFIGWVKQRMNNPLVNVGGTLASLAIISVVTKENATFTSIWDNTKLVQVLKILIIGITCSASVNLLLWRTSARNQLRKSMGSASTSLGDMLSYVTHCFLSGREEEFQSSEFSRAVAVYSSSYTAMTDVLRDAKFEHYFLGHEQIYQLDKAVYKSIETLAQSIGGLRSAANTQFALLRESEQTSSVLNMSLRNVSSLSAVLSPTSPILSRSLSHTLKSGQDRNHVLSAIHEVLDESASDSDRPGGRRHKATRSYSVPNTASNSAKVHVFRTSSEIFELFIALLGPSMKSLAYTLSEILREPVFGSAPDYEVMINGNFRTSLLDALSLFNDSRANALNELYKSIELARPSYSDSLKADFEEVAAACGHFSFSLQTFGEEMSKYLDVLDDLKHAAEDGRKKRTWGWLCFWRSDRARLFSRPALPLPYEDAERESLIGPAPTPVRGIRRSQLPQGIPSTMTAHRDTYSWQAAADANKTMMILAQRLLRFLRRCGRDDVRFGLKVGIGAMLWAMFAFIPATRPTYAHWRGEWGLLSFMIVCSMTVGASNTTGIARFIGTIFGVGMFLINWLISGGNAFVLCALGACVAFYNFNLIVAKGKAPLGRMTLLAYNVSALYAYSLSQSVDDDDDDEGGLDPWIGEIALHRSVAVTAGIIWGLIVCRLIWPISARKKFKEGLSVLYLQMGLIWKRGPLAILLRSDCTRSYLKTGEQAALQRYASRLETLRLAAAGEFELRGPFPFAPCGRILASTNRILDAFYAMSLVTQRKGHMSEGERELLLFTAKERAVLCERICHVFQVLASSLMLEYPLTESIPSITNTRDRLLAKIFQFRNDHGAAAAVLAAAEGGWPAGDASATAESAGLSSSPSSSSADAAARLLVQRDSSEVAVQKLGQWAKTGRIPVEERDYALLYAYALVTGQVAEELKVVEREIENLYGILDEEANLLE
ncbi:hypothetical protein GGTG_00422 [Gaeumannomyces tritici R3-111a-1]|uniref:Integral membrane bound transporter domain-containing protein n=1 Tax=Gaeumannomyces tritici (strain R3-111a-1) TaxID=644352 RepID=J3NGN3_GAET3|nr:hypothetical protein GGTG_00422 [Gaeumannomyces tritici R3-111a-1]EJT80423.1 hypothetical protein GGTG_00422 [Gaeumannomyces tritici R3-111a-1]